MQRGLEGGAWQGGGGGERFISILLLSLLLLRKKVEGGGVLTPPPTPPFPHYACHWRPRLIFFLLLSGGNGRRFQNIFTSAVVVVWLQHCRLRHHPSGGEGKRPNAFLAKNKLILGRKDVFPSLFLNFSDMRDPAVGRLQFARVGRTKPCAGAPISSSHNLRAFPDIPFRKKKKSRLLEN